MSRWALKAPKGTPGSRGQQARMERKALLGQKAIKETQAIPGRRGPKATKAILENGARRGNPALLA